QLTLEGWHAAGLGDMLAAGPVGVAVGLALVGRRPRLDPRDVVGLVRERELGLAAGQFRSDPALALGPVAGAAVLDEQGGTGGTCRRTRLGAGAEGAQVGDGPE